MLRSLKLLSLSVFVAALASSNWGRVALAARSVQVEPAENARARSRGPRDARALIDEANAALARVDLEVARAKVRAALDALLALPQEEQQESWAELLNDAGVAAWNAQDPRAARTAWERVLEVRSRTLAADARDLQATRSNLAAALGMLGDLPAALALQQEVLEVLSHSLPEDHRDLQLARSNVAITLKTLGDLAAARGLFEKVFAVSSATLPDGDPSLQLARANLASTLRELGELAAARVLEEKVLAVASRALPEDHPDLQSARSNLAVTLWALGDLAAARALQENVLEVRSRTFPEDHSELQVARLNLAATLWQLGDLPAAHTLFAVVHEVFSRTLPDDHPDLQAVRGNLALMLAERGDFSTSRSLGEKVLEVRSRTLPDDHSDLQAARQNLATALWYLGDLSAARSLEEEVLAVLSRTLPSDHPELRGALANLALTLAAQCAVQRGRGSPGSEDVSEFGRIAALHARAIQSAARMAVRAPTGREAEERCFGLLEHLGTSLSFANGMEVLPADDDLERAAFIASELTRGAALLSATLSSSARSDARYEQLRLEAQRASEDLARLTRMGTSTEEYARARSKRDEAERALVELSATLVGGSDQFLNGDVQALSKELGSGDALIGYRRYTRFVFDEPGSTRAHETAAMCAFVVRAENRLACIELGPLAPIERAVESWRDAIGVRLERGLSAAVDAESEIARRGTELRRLCFDPLIPALEGVERITVALDDALNLVPIDALPLGESLDSANTELVGARWRIETRATLLEILIRREPSSSRGALLAFGHVAYDKAPIVFSAAAIADAAVDTALDTQATSARDSSAPRPAWEPGFPTLPETRSEVRAIADYFEDEFGPEAVGLVLERAETSRESLFALAPIARFLHLATHGWFAPESIRSWSDPELLDAVLGFGRRPAGTEQVRGMNPMLLCGLALAGANLPPDATGRVTGLITAEELATLDLSQGELVVLSACDTNVGDRRAGQGVASLQKALQLAGARSVITSLWKVPDVATKDLMVDFYRRLWVEKKPKWQSLWEAKMKLRDARDENGEPIYTTRDWAAWVLTGEPD